MIKGLFFDGKRQNGGSYQMSINNLLSFVHHFKNNSIKYKILTNNKIKDLDKLKIKYQIINLEIWDYLFIFFKNITILSLILEILKISSSLEKKLINQKIDLVVFFKVSWKSFLLEKIKFTSTVLDTCHKDFYKKKKFKEINFFIYNIREYLFKKVLPKSYRIISESSDLKEKIIKFYKIESKLIISIPNLPSSLLLNKNKFNKLNILKKYNLEGNFYFYPAHFWEHKNHQIILKSIREMKSKKEKINFVFCGKDQGNLRHLKLKISNFDIQNNIKILGYVSDNELFALYKLSKAMVMPSYFGPTNIPPVEAWHLKVPVIYSSLNRNHGGNAALYFNPDSYIQLVKCLIKVENQKLRKKLILNGKKRLIKIKTLNTIGHKKFSSEIKRVN